MKILLAFIAALLVIMITAATTVNVMTVKPALPKQVLVKYINSSGRYDGNDGVADYIKSYVKKGYIVKSIAGTSQYGYHWIIIMEKY